MNPKKVSISGPIYKQFKRENDEPNVIVKTEKKGERHVTTRTPTPFQYRS